MAVDGGVLARRVRAFAWSAKWRDVLGVDVCRMLLLLLVGSERPDWLSEAGRTRYDELVGDAVAAAQDLPPRRAMIRALLLGEHVPHVPDDKRAEAGQALLGLEGWAYGAEVREFAPGLLEWAELLTPELAQDLMQEQRVGAAVEQVVQQLGEGGEGGEGSEGGGIAQA